jgi:hypothetical protein
MRAAPIGARRCRAINAMRSRRASVAVHQDGSSAVPIACRRSGAGEVLCPPRGPAPSSSPACPARPRCCVCRVAPTTALYLVHNRDTGVTKRGRVRPLSVDIDQDGRCCAESSSWAGAGWQTGMGLKWIVLGFIALVGGKRDTARCPTATTQRAPNWRKNFATP